jgi:hypothetical protein
VVLHLAPQLYHSRHSATLTRDGAIQVLLRFLRSREEKGVAALADTEESRAKMLFFPRRFPKLRSWRRNLT